ncbi:MAG: GspMb/PilO family protein [Candidatus Omnitrophota bacterium]|nr:GspMb/PilO family protein [Candidatus Omnitrophota bacterium]
MPSAGAMQQWQRLNKRQQRWALLLAGLVAVWGADGLLLWPLRQRLMALHREVRDTEQRLIDATVASAQVETVNQAFEQYAVYLKETGSVETELAAALTEVESAVRDLGIVLINLKQGSAGALESMVSVSVECEASPTQLVQLLDRLQRSVRLLKVTQLNVRASDAQTLRVSLVVSKLLAPFQQVGTGLVRPPSP